MQRVACGLLAGNSLPTTIVGNELPESCLVYGGLKLIILFITMHALMHLSMQSPTPPPGTGGDLSIWRCKGLTPGAILFDKPLANTPHDSFTSTIYGLLSIQTNCYDYWLYKVPTPRARFYWQSPYKAPPCPGRGVVGLCIDRCISTGDTNSDMAVTLRERPGLGSAQLQTHCQL